MHVVSTGSYPAPAVLVSVNPFCHFPEELVPLNMLKKPTRFRSGHASSHLDLVFTNLQYSVEYVRVTCPLIKKWSLCSILRLQLLLETMCLIESRLSRNFTKIYFSAIEDFVNNNTKLPPYPSQRNRASSNLHRLSMHRRHGFHITC